MGDGGQCSTHGHCQPKGRGGGKGLQMGRSWGAVGWRLHGFKQGYKQSCEVPRKPAVLMRASPDPPPALYLPPQTHLTAGEAGGCSGAGCPVQPR